MFKEFSFPFIDTQKIEQLIPYEAAHTMAIDVAHAAVDFIITEQNKEIPKTTIMIAAVQNAALQEQQQLFSHLQQHPHKYTITIFELYGLFLTIKSYEQSSTEVTYIVHTDFTSTTIGCIIGTQLKFIRIIPKGIIQVMRHVAQTLDIQSSQAFESLIRFGVTNHENTHTKKSVEDGLDLVLNDVLFTIESIKSTLPASATYKRILLVGSMGSIENITHYVTEKIGIPTEIFDINMHLKIMPIIIKNGALVPPEHTIACALALPNDKTHEFSISHSANIQQATIARIQIIAGLLLTAGIVLILMISYFWQVHSLKKKAHTLESSVISHLQSLNLSTKKILNKHLTKQMIMFQKKNIYGLHSHAINVFHF